MYLEYKMLSRPRGSLLADVEVDADASHDLVWNSRDGPETKPPRPSACRSWSESWSAIPPVFPPREEEGRRGCQPGRPRRRLQPLLLLQALRSTSWSRWC